jgi:hypothetical protein
MQKDLNLRLAADLEDFKRHRRQEVEGFQQGYGRPREEAIRP